MALTGNDHDYPQDLLAQRQLLERDIASLQIKISRLPETFNESLMPMTEMYQEILQQRLAALQALSGK